MQEHATCVMHIMTSTVKLRLSCGSWTVHTPVKFGQLTSLLTRRGMRGCMCPAPYSTQSQKEQHMTVVLHAVLQGSLYGQGLFAHQVEELKLRCQLYLRLEHLC